MVTNISNDSSAITKRAMQLVSVATKAIQADEKRSVSKNKRRHIAFQSKTMNEFFKLATQYAASSASVLITGESGTGKELFSRLIHEKSGRPKDRFIAVNCAAIAESLIESEIFGHERGAFTGAIHQKEGYFQRADGGTLLLDEISEIPISMQAKLLRVIEEQEVQTVGGTQPQPIDVRIVATSNRNLKEAVDRREFRSDLYHRLNVVELNIPPLRDRKSDIPLLVMHFVEMFQHESENGIKRVSKDAMAQLCAYAWPGNVRELRNVIHRACIVAQNGEIDLIALPSKLNHAEGTKSDHHDMESSDQELISCLSLADIERRVIVARLRKFNGNKKSAAAELGVTARTLSNKLRHYHASGLLNSDS